MSCVYHYYRKKKHIETNGLTHNIDNHSTHRDQWTDTQI